MKRRGRTIFLSLMLIASLSISLIPIYPGTNSFAETITPQADFVVPVTPLTDAEVPADYIKITTKEELDNIRNNLSGKYILMNDIVFTDADFAEGGDFYNSGNGWLPIGGNDFSRKFTGILDGNGCTISGMKMHYQGSGKVTLGLIGSLGSSGIIKNLAMDKCNYTMSFTRPSSDPETSYAGFLTGIVVDGLVSNVIVNGTIISSCEGNRRGFYGGVAGIIEGSSVIENALNKGSINIEAHYSDHYIGGIAGSVKTTSAILKSRNTGNLKSSIEDESTNIGGIAGMDEGIISKCSNAGAISAKGIEESSANAGGIVGYSYGNVNSSYNTGGISATGPDDKNAGGIVGKASSIFPAPISDCYNLGKIYSSAADFLTGDIVNSGDDFNSRTYSGGIVGNSYSAITNCYNIGAVTAHSGLPYAGAIAGTCESATNCYYLSDIVNNSYGKALTSTQMQYQSAYTGFDFTNIWVINSALKLPTLRQNEPILVASISFVSGLANVAKGGTIKLASEILPTNADAKITYKSANTAVATVSSIGIVTGVSLGSTTITVTDGYTGKSAACFVYVRQGIDTLKISGAGAVDVGSTTQLSTTITPTAPYDNTIIWRSSDENIATVSATGLVTGIKAGYATVYATAKLGTPATQNVTHSIQIIQHPVSVELDTNLMDIAVGETLPLTATVLPEDTTNKDVTWSSSDDSVVAVTSEGNVTAISRGEVTITAKTVDGALEATCTVNAIQKVESVWITYDNLPLAEYTIAQGASVQFIPDIQPDNSNDQGITWYTSDPNVIAVDGTGLVTAISEGIAIVTIVSDDENKVDTCVVYVGPQQTGTLEINSDSLKDGEPVDFTQTELTVPSLSSFLAVDRVSKGYALVDPVPVQLSKPQWSTSDPTVATVDKLGYVHVVGAGPVIITAYATDSGRVTSSKEVTIIRDFSITYKLNGGTNPSGAPAAYTYATGCTLAKPTRTGYAFGGWYEASNFTGSPVTAISITDKGDKTLYAKWIPNTYTIKFNDNGVTTGTMASLPVTYDVAKNLPANAFKKTGYAFLGWAKTSTGSVAYKDKASVKNLTATNKATVNLYAKWGAPILSAASYNYTGIKVSWATAGGATSYKIYRATSATGSYYLVKTAASTIRSWIDTGRTTGKTYYYKIYPVAGGTTYKFSTYKSAKAVPATPTVTLSKNTSTSIKVTWTGVSGATKYQVYRAVKSSTSSTYGDYALVYTGSSDTRSWIDTGRHIGSTYKYKVRAYHLEGTTKVYGGYAVVKYLKI